MTKVEKYTQFLTQSKSLLAGEHSLIANLANFSALYFEIFKPHWVGFYLVEKKELVLGPFQGPVACTRIGLGKGVCGTAWETLKTVIVPDVHQFPGHIACSAFSNSEIVLPLFKNNQCIGVFDIDASTFSAFDTTDQLYLEQALNQLSLSIA